MSKEEYYHRFIHPDDIEHVEEMAALAPEDRKAGMFGLYYLIRDTIVSLAAFGGAFLWAIRPEVNLLAAFGFGLLGTIWFAARGRDLGRAPAAG